MDRLYASGKSLDSVIRRAQAGLSVTRGAPDFRQPILTFAETASSARSPELSNCCGDPVLAMFGASVLII